MLRHDSSVSAKEIKQLGLQLVQSLLPWQDRGRFLTVDLIARLLLLMATLKASLHGLAQRFCLPCSLNTLRNGISSQLPAAKLLAQEFGRVFRTLIPCEPVRGFCIAIDTHWVGFYGQKQTKGIVRGQRKAGTRRFFVYATAVVLEKGRRYTLAMTPVESNRPHEALTPLLDEIRMAGLQIRMLLLDKAFFATSVFEYLQQYAVPFVVAVPHRRAHLKSLWNSKRQKQATLTMTPGHRPNPSRKPVTVSLVRFVVAHRHRPDRTSVQVYAYGGWSRQGNVGEACRREYRSRFGIETSYRQLNQAKGRTTSKDLGWRVLLIGLSLLFRQIWVFLEQAFRRRHGKDWIAETALERLRSQLAHSLMEGWIDQDRININPEDAKFWNAMIN